MLIFMCGIAVTLAAIQQGPELATQHYRHFCYSNVIVKKVNDAWQRSDENTALTSLALLNFYLVRNGTII